MPAPDEPAGRDGSDGAEFEVPDHVPTSWVDDDPALPQDVVHTALLVVPVTRATALAQVCALAGVQGVVVPVRGAGCAVVLHEPTTAEAAAQTISTVLGRGEVLLVTRSGPEGGSGTSGQLAATRWRVGVLHDAPAPGVLLATLPDGLERLVLGLGDPAQAAGAVDTRTVPAVQAATGVLGSLFRRRRPGGPGPDGGPAGTS